MINKVILDQSQILGLASAAAEKIRKHYQHILDVPSKTNIKFYGVPRGGIPVAYALLVYLSKRFELVMTPEEADFFVDDLIDSGATLIQYDKKYPGKPFFALIDKRIEENPPWVVFPWEVGEEDIGPTKNIVRLLQFVGEDPNRGGLLETPARVIKAWQEWSSGYNQEPKEVLKVFEDGGDGYDEMVLVRDIPFYSHCEHHMAPFFGTVTIGYIPNKKIVGLSKLSRLVDVFAKRLQVQERLTVQIAEALSTNLTDLGVAVVVTARHLCMESRGIQKQGQDTVTSSMQGALRTKPEARAEFFSLLHRK